MGKAPFAVGDRVSVVRTRHGWHDGRLAATVIQQTQRPAGTWRYLVRDDKGQDHEVRHTRDMRLARG